jgi:hypothetical protein
MKKLMFIVGILITSLVVNAQRVKVNSGEAHGTAAPEECLPKEILDNIAKEHAGFKIKSAVWDWSTTIVPNNTFIYGVVITNGTTDEILLYDKNGKFLKKGVEKDVEIITPERRKRETDPAAPAPAQNPNQR